MTACSFFGTTANMISGRYDLSGARQGDRLQKDRGNTQLRKQMVRRPAPRMFTLTRHDAAALRHYAVICCGGRAAADPLSIRPIVLSESACGTYPPLSGIHCLPYLLLTVASGPHQQPGFYKQCRAQGYCCLRALPTCATLRRHCHCPSVTATALLPGKSGGESPACPK